MRDRGMKQPLNVTITLSPMHDILLTDIAKALGMSRSKVVERLIHRASFNAKELRREK